VNQEEYFGISSINHLPAILKRIAAQRMFLVTGDKSFLESGASAFFTRNITGIAVKRFYEFGALPRLEDVERGVKMCRVFAPDVVVAVGGGTVLDIAKLVNLFSLWSGSISEFLFQSKTVDWKVKPLVAIPTTSGSGSEATHFAVLYVGNTKYSVANQTLLPSVAIVDPALTLSLSPHHTAVSGMDAFSQAVESYWCIHSTDESKGYAREAIELVCSNLITAVHKGTEESRIAMAKAAHLAGKAINITKTTAPHALSYALTAWFGVPHGQAVGFTLPSFLEYNSNVTAEDVTDQRGVEYVKKTVGEVISFLGCATVKSGKEWIQQLMKEIGLATTFKELGLEKTGAIQKLLDDVNLERLVNNPRGVNNLKMEELLEKL